jgi:hypothetical protein
VPLRLPESALVAYSLGIHKKSTVAREVRPLDALEAPAPEARDSPPTVPIVTPPASPQKQEPADAKAHASAPAAPRLEPAGPYGYGEFREDANTDPVFTPVSAPSTHFSPSPRDPRASSGRKNSLGTIVAPIGTPSAPSPLLAPPPPEAPPALFAPPPPPALPANAAECPCCLQPGRDTALVPCGHILCGTCVAAHVKKGDSDGACPVCRAPVLNAMRIFL